MRRLGQERTEMGDTLDDIYWERNARHEREEREQEDRTVLRKRQRKAFMTTLLEGDDMSAWLAPESCAPSDEVLSEHMAQLRNGVRKEPRRTARSSRVPARRTCRHLQAAL